MKIAFYSCKPYEINAFNKENNKHHIEYFEFPLNQFTAEKALGFEAVCIFVNDKVDLACIKVLKKQGVKIIALRCAGFNNVDIAACKEEDIIVVRVPSYSPHAVAEHTMALLLTLNRKTHRAYNRVRECNFSLQGLMGFDLYKKTIGIIGLGNIGKVFADICSGFGCEVLAFDPVVSSYKNIQVTSLDDLFARADILSLHCPLNKDTFHFINRESIAKMKSGIVLLNTGRGALIDTKAVIDALKMKKIGAFGIDVYEQEEGIFFGDHSEDIIQDDILMRLMTFPNVLVTSHQGFFTIEALQQIANTTLNNLSLIEAGKMPAQIVVF